MVVVFPRAEDLHFGRDLRRVREARGFSLDQLASRSGLGAERLALAEQGRNRLTATELHALINTLRIPLGLLFSPPADLSALRRLV
jgi:transcriptional regulator with XRE-family HTH domain